MTATVGDRFLDTRGQTWTVLESGQLQNTLAPGVLIRSWDSLDTCLGPLFLMPPDETENDMPKPGDKYRDRDGDTWIVRGDGLLDIDGEDDGDPWTYAKAERVAGPLTPLGVGDQPEPDMVNNPPHYQTDSGIEAIDVIDAFFANNYNLASVFKYMARAGKKDDAVQDLSKARWYLDREIARLEDAA